MSAPHRFRSRRRRRAAVSVVAAALVLPAIAAIAQYRVDGGGMALDRNLEVNSGGINRPVGRARYAPRRQASPFIVSRSGDMRYSPQNAFSPRQRYEPTRYSGNRWNQTSYSRFRYQGQY